MVVAPEHAHPPLSLRCICIRVRVCIVFCLDLDMTRHLEMTKELLPLLQVRSIRLTRIGLQVSLKCRLRVGVSRFGFGFR